uniref:Kininogen (Fragments) n=1 Tax=Gadus morhua TaxID=8049 RepID=KNG_GADMO|nr:RecName: Full=Kininogen; Contains: RecName: Full=Bradykinin [Gadus morhua]
RHEVPQANLECDEGAMDLKISTGNMVALYQILSASKDSDCPAGGAVTWTDQVVAGLRICMGCPVELDLESEELKVPVAVSISKRRPPGWSPLRAAVTSFNEKEFSPPAPPSRAEYSLYFDMRK